MKKVLCATCSLPLTNDEVALSLKMFRYRYVCMDCAAKRACCSKEDLLELVKYYKSGGCDVFSQHYVDN